MDIHKALEKRGIDQARIRLLCGNAGMDHAALGEVGGMRGHEAVDHLAIGLLFALEKIALLETEIETLRNPKS